MIPKIITVTHPTIQTTVMVLNATTKQSIHTEVTRTIRICGS